MLFSPQLCSQGRGLGGRGDGSDTLWDRRRGQRQSASGGVLDGSLGEELACVLVYHTVVLGGISWSCTRRGSAGLQCAESCA